MRRSVHLAVGVLLTAMLVLGWAVFAPTQLGGDATYVLTNGTSMQPVFHTNDLVILRRSQSYAVGDIVAYHNPNLGQILHRIVAIDGDRVVLKGDNNANRDIYEPAKHELLGKLWIHLPGAGNVLRTARQPFVAAGLMGGGALMAVAKPLQKRRRRFLRKGAGKGSARVFGAAGQLAFSLATLLLVTGLAAGFVAFTSPTTKTELVDRGYQRITTIDYAAAAPTAVFPTGTATTGQPIYTRVSASARFTLTYHLDDAEARLGGSIGLDAVIRSSDGWTRTVTLQTPTAFDGTSATASGVLDLKAVAASIESYRQAAQLPESPVINVHIVGHVVAAGTLDGATLQERVEPEGIFNWTGFAMVPTELKTFDQTTSASVKIPTERTNSFQWLGLGVSVATMRLASALFAIAGAALFSLLALLAFLGGRAPESARIGARYGSLLVSIRAADIGSDRPVFDVATIDDLVRVAVREGRMILHETRDGRHTYYVQDDEVTYRYLTVDPIVTGEAQPAESSV